MTNETTTKTTKTRQLRGTVVSDKMDKTVMVEITRLKMNPKYKKQYKVSTKYASHDPENAHHIGEVVTIRETRPLSKTKRWVVTGLAGDQTKAKSS